MPASPPSSPVYPGCGPVAPLGELPYDTCVTLIPLWIILIAYCFFALALVCEEFLVPAINIVCVKTGIPDDVAGATLLAAGCNSPEFFASVIGIFIADSTVGVGTVVGSAPFNVCVITAGASMAVGGALYLDPWLMGRELIGLLIALLLFLVFMDDYRIMWYEALIMFGYYALIYVPVLAYFDRMKIWLLQRLNRVEPISIEGIESDKATLQLDYDGSQEDSKKLSTVRETLREQMRDSVAQSLRMSLQASAKLSYDVPAPGITARAETVPGMGHELLPMSTIKSGGFDPSPDPNSLWSKLVEDCLKRYDGYSNSGTGMSGLLNKRAKHFTKVRNGKRIYQTRWFTLDAHPTNPFRYSRLERDGVTPITTKFKTVPLQYVTNIERCSKFEIILVTKQETIMLRSPGSSPSDQTHMQMWFDHLVVRLEEVRKAPTPVEQLAGEELPHEEHPPWYKAPDDTMGKVFHCATFGIKALVFLTTPNVLKHDDKMGFAGWGNEKWFLVTIIISMIWLALFATLMTDVIEYLGCALGIGSTVMGLSFGAVGTSFPNLYASILVAKSGQGGMSICQAIASNTFNVCICLGFLWLLHTVDMGSCDYIYHGAKHGSGACNGCYAPSGLTPLCPYLEGTNNAAGSQPGSTKGAVLVVFVWMVLFIGTLIVCKLHVRKIPAILMFCLYGLYIVYEFANAFGLNFPICFDTLNICI